MFTKYIGIDLGTANTLVYMKNKGIIIREPSVVAVNTRDETASYVGIEAKEIIGKLDPKYAENDVYIGGMYNSFIDSLGYFKDKFIFEHTKDEISDHFIKFYK